MTDIKKLTQRLEQIEAEKQDIRNRLTKTNRQNATSRKIELGVHLLKLAETDESVHSSLTKVWAIAKINQPKAFINTKIPQAPRDEIKFD